MHKKNIFFIASALYPTAGGLTKSLYDKANYLSNFHNVTIITTNFQLHLEQIIKELQLNDKLSKRVKTKNLFVNLSQNDSKQGLDLPSNLECQNLLKNLENFNVNKVKNGKDLRVFSKIGLYKNYISYHENGNIFFIDFMNSLDFNYLEKRYSFYQNNLLSLEVYNTKNEKKQQVIYNVSKHPILNLFYKNNNIVRVFDMSKESTYDRTLQDLIKIWLQGFIKDTDITIFDSEFLKNSEIFKDIHCKKIGFIHSHQDYCNDTKFLKSFENFDKFVFLTKLQQEDFKNFNSSLYSKSVLLPHPAPKQKNQLYKNNKIVTISRLVHNKPLSNAIKAFSAITHKFPEYIYEIYGIGPEKENLAQLINELQLQDKVFLKGYTNHALEIFLESKVSISLTNFEGFGLSILESLSMHCPVITSNVKYGPNEMIIDNVNGFLVENESVSSIEYALTRILNDPIKYQKNCLKTITKNSLVLWQENLLKIIDDV